MISILLAAVWGVILYYVGRGKHELAFYLMNAIPILIGIGALLLLSLPEVLTAVLLTILIVERALYTISLYDTASKRKVGWYIVVFVIPFGWLLYKVIA